MKYIRIDNVGQSAKGMAYNDNSSHSKDGRLDKSSMDIHNLDLDVHYMSYVYILIDNVDQTSTCNDNYLTCAKDIRGHLKR